MTLATDARAVLGGWPAPTPEQERLRRRYVDWLDARPDAVRRSCAPHHLTASTLLLDSTRSRTLLTLHRRAGAWFQLGGHCEDDDATLARAALREATEESGIAGLVVDPVPVQLSEHEVPFCGRTPEGAAYTHLDVRFVAVAPPGATPVVSEESTDLRWWPLDELPTDAADLVELVALAASRQPSTASSSSPGGSSSRAAVDQPSR
ncbi:NUDIX hydrolase [Nocardioides sp. SYSU D00038]|uniref:NUDIX hydrolase n=1 Tax=Nocardioides sp. SYSU D00038 TaxID=2812554 RepID=UPI0019679D3A|nr:NUDIX hydrolase [Nocardioides sp. SYSU D00038]